MIKLKDILSEAYAWERQEGKPLPTLKDVQTAYRKNLQENVDEMDADIAAELVHYGFAKSEEAALRALDNGNVDHETIHGVYKSDSLTQQEKAQTIADMLDFEEDERGMNRNEAYDAKGVKDAVDEAEEDAKPDYIDLDGDGNEEESMKDAAADMQKKAEQNPKDGKTKEDLPSKDLAIQQMKEEETEKEADNAADDASVDMDVLNMGSLEESAFWNRVKGNLHGHEYILREAFRK